MRQNDEAVEEILPFSFSFIFDIIECIKGENHDI